MWRCLCSIKLKAKTMLASGLKCFWEITQAIAISINFKLKCFTAAKLQRPAMENAKVISLSKNKLEHVKLQDLIGAIFLKHINTVKTNCCCLCISCVCSILANFVASWFMSLISADILVNTQTVRCNSDTVEFKGLGLVFLHWPAINTQIYCKIRNW